MCGIFVAIAKGTKAIDPALCSRATDRLRWRGPDSYCTRQWDGDVFFGQTILSLTGRVKPGDWQHLTSPSGRYVLVFNGEIYNYKALAAEQLKWTVDVSTTDTAVIAAMHEKMPAEDVLRKLDGMFAYVVYDTLEKRIIAARDPQGEKSLYICDHRDFLILSSEISPICELVGDLELDPQILRDYFGTRHLMQPTNTVYRDVKQMRPGHLTEIRLPGHTMKESQVTSIYDWVDEGIAKRLAKASLADLEDELDGLFCQSISEMLPMENPYAAIVSGGIDSSLIASYLTRLGKPSAYLALNHVSKDHISNDLSGFEKALDHKIDVKNVSLAKYASSLKIAQSIMRSPLFAHSFVGQSIVSEMTATHGCKVLFGGDGADEAFGGYEAYQKITADSLESSFSPSPYSTYKDPSALFEKSDGQSYQSEISHAWKRALEAYHYEKDPLHKASKAAMLADLQFQLSSVGLRGADLMAMGWSVETRNPFIRKPILQFALNLPMTGKTALDISCPNPLMKAKYLLKKLFVRAYSEDLVAPKQGFSGFPNETQKYLGEPRNFLTWNFLGVKPAAVEKILADRALEWKLINIEHFLRSQIRFR